MPIIFYYTFVWFKYVCVCDVPMKYSGIYVAGYLDFSTFTCVTFVDLPPLYHH